MPKPPLKPEYAKIEGDMIATLLAGLKEWRPDLKYPESHSDMQACVRGALKMFEICRRPLGLSNKDIVEPQPTCGLSGCGQNAHFAIGTSMGAEGLHFCGNDHAREWMKSMLDSVIGSKGERGLA